MGIFDGSQKEIGRGAQAVVYKYNGYAYKVYNDSYPKQYIQWEYMIQDVVNGLDLPVVKYYQTDADNVIRMDLIDGVTLADRMKEEQYSHGFEDMIQLQKKIISNQIESLPSLKEYSIIDLEHMDIEPFVKEHAIHILNTIPETRNLLHMDLHFLNIMYAQGKYYVIDWMNAKAGNPIYDYARSYIILNEIASELSEQYLTLLTEDSEIDLTYFDQAVYVLAILRTNEHKSERTIELIKKYEHIVSKLC